MRPTTRRAFPVAFALAILLALMPAQGCDQKGTGGAKIVKLGFVTNNPSQFWKIAANGIHKYEREANVQVDIRMPPNGTPEDQNAILQNLASQGYDAVSVSVVAPNDQVGVLNKVAERTHLLTFDSDAPKSNRLLYIGTNNYDAGKILGAAIVKLLPHGGKLAVFVGTMAADNAAQRFKGVEDAIVGHEIEVVEKREDYTDRARARSNVEDIINARTDLAMCIGLWNYNGPAIAAAIDALGKKGKVLAVAFDEDEGTLDAIANGTIQATVVQKPYQFGYLASKWMHELSTQGEKAKAALPSTHVIDTGVEVIRPDNLADFRLRLAELKK